MCQRKELRLLYLGDDSWGRPVYKDDTGKLWKDVQPVKGMKPDLCTSVGNAFDGESDTGMEYMEAYKDVSIVFKPERILW